MLHKREGVVPIPYKIVSCSSENSLSKSGNLNSETGVLSDRNACWLSSSYNTIIYMIRFPDLPVKLEILLHYRAEIEDMKILLIGYI